MTLDELKQRAQDEKRQLRALEEKIRKQEKAQRDARWQALGKVVEEVLGVTDPETVRMALTGGHRNGAAHSMERPLSISTDILSDVDSAAVSEGESQPDMGHAEGVTEETGRLAIGNTPGAYGSLPTEHGGERRGLWGRR